MKPIKFANNRISLSYKGASVLATGNLAKVIAYSFAGMLLLIGIAAIQRATVAK